MDAIYDLKEMLCKELEEYGRKGKVDVGALEVVDKLAHAVKNLDKILEKYEEEEYSERGMSYDGGNMGNMGSARGSYRGEQGGSSYRGSYARGRNARRDSRGRYSSRYSREYSREGGMEEMAESIREMMGELPQHIQSKAQQFVQALEQEVM